MRVLQGSAFQVAVVRMWWEELDAAKDSFARMLDRAVAIGDESSVPYIRVLLAQTECLRGRLRRRGAMPTRARSAPSRAARRRSIAYALSLRRSRDAYGVRRRPPARRRRGRSSWPPARPAVPAEQFATAALGLLELSLERDAAAVEVLAPLVAFAREQEMREPGLTRFVPDLVEALVSLGRLDEAEDHLAWFAANAERLVGRRAREPLRAAAASSRLLVAISPAP